MSGVCKWTYAGTFQIHKYIWTMWDKPKPQGS